MTRMILIIMRGRSICAPMQIEPTGTVKATTTETGTSQTQAEHVTESIQPRTEEMVQEMEISSDEELGIPDDNLTVEKSEGGDKGMAEAIEFEPEVTERAINEIRAEVNDLFHY